MTACTILYASFYGSTKEYADELAKRLGTTAEPIPDADFTPEGPIVVLAPIHGPNNPGASFIRKLPDPLFDAHSVSLVTVGMSLDEVAVDKDFSAKLLGSRADSVTRFYLPGRMNYSELSAAHAATMAGVVGALRLKPRKSANDRMMIDTYNKDVDRVDFTRLAPVEAWVRDNA